MYIHFRMGIREKKEEEQSENIKEMQTEGETLF